MSREKYEIEFHWTDIFPNNDVPPEQAEFEAGLPEPTELEEKPF